MEQSYLLQWMSFSCAYARGPLFPSWRITLINVQSCTSEIELAVHQWFITEPNMPLTWNKLVVWKLPVEGGGEEWFERLRGANADTNQFPSAVRKILLLTIMVTNIRAFLHWRPHVLFWSAELGKCWDFKIEKEREGNGGGGRNPRWGGLQSMKKGVLVFQNGLSC